MSANLALSIGYLGSDSDHLDATGLFNTAQSPAPGTPAQVNQLRPFPRIDGTPFFGSDRGNANLQCAAGQTGPSLREYLVSYTWSKLSLFKNFLVTESATVSFRAEFFNIFNIQNYGAPNSLIGDPAAGRITSNVIPPRQIQFGLHLPFFE